MKVLIIQPKLEREIVQLERELHDAAQIDAVVFPEGYLNENVKEACTLAKKYGVVLIGGYRKLHQKLKDHAIMINRQGEIIIDRIKYSDTVFAIQDGLKIGHILCHELIEQGSKLSGTRTVHSLDLTLLACNNDQDMEATRCRDTTFLWFTTRAWNNCSCARG